MPLENLNDRAAFAVVARVRKRAAGVWQRRYWEHTIRDERDSAVHMDYIHFNPVKHGLAARLADWPFLGFAKCVRLGLYPIDWRSRGPDWPVPGSGCDLRWWAEADPTACYGLLRLAEWGKVECQAHSTLRPAGLSL